MKVIKVVHWWWQSCFCWKFCSPCDDCPISGQIFDWVVGYINWPGCQFYTLNSHEWKKSLCWVRQLQWVEITTRPRLSHSSNYARHCNQMGIKLVGPFLERKLFFQSVTFAKMSSFPVIIIICRELFCSTLKYLLFVFYSLTKSSSNMHNSRHHGFVNRNSHTPPVGIS